MPAVSVVICCHNSAHELPETLAHLSRQTIDDPDAWEVIVIDNASTDGTADVALRIWQGHTSVAFRVVREDRLGLIHARLRGAAEARHEILSFIDDDNWVCPDWIERVARTFEEHPDVGACGGRISAVFEGGVEPAWFNVGQASYAIGTQGPHTGYVPERRGHLWGAGLSIRASAWQQAVVEGLSPRLVGSQGKNLSRGDDTEICYALRLFGWKLWYDEALTLSHHIPKERQSWRHLRQLRRGGGQASVYLDAYRYALSKKMESMPAEKSIPPGWHSEFLASIRFLAIHPKVLFLGALTQGEGRREALIYEKHLGRLTALLKVRSGYNQMHESVSVHPVDKAPSPIP